MAKAASLADSLGKQLECAVCLEQYTEPKVLPCLHSFCKRCLQGLLTQKGAECKINCPTCRSSSEIPQGEIDLLPANFFVNNLLSVVALHEDSGSTILECDICESGDPPVNRCTTCSHFLCEFCSQAHQRGRNTSSHRLMSLEEAKRMGSVAVTKPAICKEHEGEVMKLFCETCEEAICRDCTIVKHRNHKYSFVKDVFVKGKEFLLKILSETRPRVVVLKEAINGVLEMKENVKYCAEFTMQEIDECFKDLTACLDSRHMKLIAEVQKLQSAKCKSLDSQQETLETALASVESSLDFTEKALENGSEVEILNMRKQMSTRLAGLNSSIWQLQPSVTEGLKFKDNPQLKQVIASFGVVTDVVTNASMSTVTMGNGEEGVMYNTLCGQQVQFNIFSKEYSGRRRQEGGDIFEMSVSPVSSRGTLVHKPQAKDHGNGTYSFCPAQLQAGSYELSVKLKDCHVQGSPFTWAIEEWNLQVFSSSAQRVNQPSIKFSQDHLTAYAQEYNMQYSHALYGGHYRSLAVRMRSFPCNSNTAAGLYFGGSIGFKSGKHMWRVQIHLNGQSSNVSGCSFGIATNSTTKSRINNLLELGASKWVCCPQERNKVAFRSDDIIELYLNFDNKTLMIYNLRTSQSEIRHGVEGEVSPVFQLPSQGGNVSLKNIPLSI